MESHHTSPKSMLESLLFKVSKEFPKRNISCLKNILILSLSILRSESVCLNKLKGTVGEITGNSSTKPASNYKRLNRIFISYSFSSLWLELLQYAFMLLRLKSEYLVLDGTSWQRGERKYHYLTLGVVYQGIVIPIYWEDLEKKGTSNYKERRKLILKAMRYFNLEGKTLLADREYIGSKWFNFLTNCGLSYVIRVRKNTYREEIDKAAGMSYSQMEHKVLRSEKKGKAVGKSFMLAGSRFYFVMCKNFDQNSKDPVLFLITNLEVAAAQAARKYMVRWKIETCFRHLKSNGFHLEEMNVKGKFRANLLIAVTVFTYTLSIHEGLKEYKDVPLKVYADGKLEKEASIFRFGIDKLKPLANSLSNFILYILKNISLSKNAYRSRKAIYV